jgi:hypothetical protein
VVDQLENGLQNADNCAVRAVHAFVEPAQPVEVTEELVGTVYKMDDDFGFRLRFHGAFRVFEVDRPLRRAMVTDSAPPTL